MQEQYKRQLDTLSANMAQLQREKSELEEALRQAAASEAKGAAGAGKAAALRKKVAALNKKVGGGEGGRGQTLSLTRTHARRSNPFRTRSARTRV